MDVLFWTLNAFSIVYVLYFALIVLLGAFRKPAAYPKAAPKKRIAAVLAARNEEGVIGEAVRTLLAQDYPRELFDVWVIPNNCTDDTEGVAEQAGARVLTCTDSVRGKGDVLRFAFSHLLSTGRYDAFCIFLSLIHI